MKGILSGLLVMMAVLFIVSCGDDGTETPDTDTVINTRLNSSHSSPSQAEDGIRDGDE